MKKFLLIICTIAISTIGKSQVQKADLQASGLTCSMCNKSISAALKNVIFVESVLSDINNNMFTITFKPGLKPDFDLLKKKVQDAGFSVASLWVYAHFKQLTITKDEHVNVGGLNIHFVDVKQQVLNGEKKIQVIDKDFTTGKNYKKFAALTTMECFKTGVMSPCCKEEKTSVAQQRVYHVTI